MSSIDPEPQQALDESKVNIEEHGGSDNVQIKENVIKNFFDSSKIEPSSESTNSDNRIELQIPLSNASNTHASQSSHNECELPSLIESTADDFSETVSSMPPLIEFVKISNSLDSRKFETSSAKTENSKDSFSCKEFFTPSKSNSQNSDTSSQNQNNSFLHRVKELEAEFNSHFSTSSSKDNSETLGISDIPSIASFLNQNDFNGFLPSEFPLKSSNFSEDAHVSQIQPNASTKDTYSEMSGNNLSFILKQPPELTQNFDQSFESKPTLPTSNYFPEKSVHKSAEALCFDTHKNEDFDSNNSKCLEVTPTILHAFENQLNITQSDLDRQKETAMLAGEISNNVDIVSDHNQSTPSQKTYQNVVEVPKKDPYFVIDESQNNSNWECSENLLPPIYRKSNNYNKIIHHPIFDSPISNQNSICSTPKDCVQNASFKVHGSEVNGDQDMTEKVDRSSDDFNDSKIQVPSSDLLPSQMSFLSMDTNHSKMIDPLDQKRSTDSQTNNESSLNPSIQKSDSSKLILSSSHISSPDKLSYFEPIPSVESSSIHRDSDFSTQQSENFLIFDSDFLDTGIEAVDLISDNQLIKTILQKGSTSSNKPTIGDLVKIKYNVRFLETSTEIAHGGLSFIIGENDVEPGLDLCIRSMHIHEKARISIPWMFGYGEFQWKLNSTIIPPKTSLIYCVYLESFESFPSDNHDSSFIEKICQEKKLRGNNFFNIGDFYSASLCYNYCLKYLEKVLDKKAVFINQVRNNLALCNYKLGKISESIELLHDILLHDPANWKALFRMSLVLEAQGDLNGALSYLDKCQNLDDKTLFSDDGPLFSLDKRIDNLKNRICKNQEEVNNFYSKIFKEPPSTTPPSSTEVPAPDSSFLGWKEIFISSAVLLGLGFSLTYFFRRRI